MSPARTLRYSLALVVTLAAALTGGRAFAQATVQPTNSVDSESSDANHAGWKRGLRIGSARDGKVRYFIPDPEKNPTGTSAAEGVAIDARGNLYGAEVGPKAVKKYVKP